MTFTCEDHKHFVILLVKGFQINITEIYKFIFFTHVY